MSKADLHIHTTYSWDGMMTPAAALKAAHMAGLDVIAITDHDEIGGAFKALELAGKYGLEVIPGIEITTADGHLLALFVHQLIPPGLPLIETLLMIGAQGGLAIAPHPLAPMTHSLGRRPICTALSHSEARQVLAGIEVFNGGLPYRRSNLGAKALADSLPVAQVGSSDAHIFWSVGIGGTEFPGRTAADFRRALIDRKTWPLTLPGIFAAKNLVGWILHYGLKRAGWITSNPQPHLPLVLARFTQ
jgi:predicted metal-dependent phosphoesterase TrpH